MADKQISDLTSASALTDGSLFVLEQAGAAMKANWGMMKQYLSPGIAEQYSTSKTYAVGDYCIYNDTLKRCIVPITTPESYTEAHWATAVIGDEVVMLRNAFDPDNAVNVLSLVPMASGIAHGVTYKWDGEAMHLSGTSDSSGAACNIWIWTTPYLPKGIDPGDNLIVKVDGAGNNIWFNIAFYNGSTVVGNDRYFEYDGVMTVPDNANAARIRVYVSPNTATNRTIRIKVLKTQTNKELAERIDAFGNVADIVEDGDIGYTAALNFENLRGDSTYNGITYTWNADKTLCSISGTSTGESFNNIYADDVFPYELKAGDYLCLRFSTTDTHVTARVFFRPLGTFYDFTGDSDILIPEGATGGVVRLQVSDTGVTVNGTASLNVYTARANRELTKDWNEAKHLRVLMIGNSYTNDCSAYAPLIVENISRSVSITLGTTYYSGASIDDYSGWFDNDSAVLTYYKYKSRSGKYATAQTGRTLKQCVADEPWDIIVFQQASTDQGTWSTFSNLNTLIDKVLAYHASVHGNPVKVGWMFPQLRYGLIETVTYEDVVDCVEKVMQTTPCSFFFPCGTAVQNARGTTLDNIGDSGHLCADGNGHLQAGLPSLIPSYVTALKLLELAGEPWHGVLQDHIRPTAAWVSAINSPGENGTSTGVTDANCYLAQKCAVAAIKFPTTVTVVV